MLSRLRYTLVWLTGWPLLLGGWILDRITGGFLARPGWSNTFRVLARRTQA